jgi:uncharacterized BrkB/YihY/UPF0761 family membrane protein
MYDNDDSDDDGGSFGGLIGSALAELPLKLAFFLFLIYLIFHSDIFQTKIIGNISGAMGATGLTTWGTTISGLFLSMAFILLYVAVDKKII